MTGAANADIALLRSTSWAVIAIAAAQVVTFVMGTSGHRTIAANTEAGSERSPRGFVCLSAAEACRVPVG